MKMLNERHSVGSEKRGATKKVKNNQTNDICFRAIVFLLSTEYPTPGELIPNSFFSVYLPALDPAAYQLFLSPPSLLFCTLLLCVHE
jgi:hypothetical protein